MGLRTNFGLWREKKKWLFAMGKLRRNNMKIDLKYNLDDFQSNKTFASNDILFQFRFLYFVHLWIRQWINNNRNNNNSFYSILWMLLFNSFFNWVARERRREREREKWQLNENIIAKRPRLLLLLCGFMLEIKFRDLYLICVEHKSEPQQKENIEFGSRDR